MMDIVDLTGHDSGSPDSGSGHRSSPELRDLRRSMSVVTLESGQNHTRHAFLASNTSQAWGENVGVISNTDITRHGSSRTSSRFPHDDRLFFERRPISGQHDFLRSRPNTISNARDPLQNNRRGPAVITRPLSLFASGIPNNVLHPESNRVQKKTKPSPTQAVGNAKLSARVEKDSLTNNILNQNRDPSICISDEDEDEDPDTSSKIYHQSLQRVRAHENSHHIKSQNAYGVVEITSDSEDENEDIEEIPDIVPFSVIPEPLQDDSVQITKVVTREPTRSSTEGRPISQIKGPAYNCVPGKCVELEDGTFIRIKNIFEDRDGSKWITGQLFLRHNDFKDHKWPLRHNELILSVKVENGQLIDLVRRPLEQVRRNRHLILTNQCYPHMSSRVHPEAFMDVHMDKELGPLFCRWKRTHYLSGKKTVEESIERLLYADADRDARNTDWHVRNRWRRVPTIPGGDHNLKRIMVTGDSEPEIQQTRSYTYGDAFCGGGGASCGALLAGLFVKFGVDMEEKAMKTYRLNFEAKGTECFEQDIHYFINDIVAGQYIVDVLHISPPCQPYSPAHTVANQQQDERNEAAMLSVFHLLQKLKPRAVTLEETYGLISRHERWFNGLIRMFLDCGYSIRWTGAHLEQYGLPQRRQRLLIIATGPGEALPAFPAPTHSKTNANLLPLVTIHDAINSIPGNPSTVTHHNIAAATYAWDRQKPAYSPHVLAKTITCTGGIGNHHPSGRRNFTVRELASLQRFPLDYKFADLGVTALRKQIGNAVPPFVFKKIFRAVVDSLKKTDGIL